MGSKLGYWLEWRDEALELDDDDIMTPSTRCSDSRSMRTRPPEITRLLLHGLWSCTDETMANGATVCIEHKRMNDGRAAHEAEWDPLWKD